jgi:5-methylcytosine-specific restriction endonuclease McrA
MLALRPSHGAGAETVEHLKPLSLGGTDDLKNLVLCHPGCNRQLGNRPAWQKIRMRDRRRLRAKRRKAGETIGQGDEAAAGHLMATRAT